VRGPRGALALFAILLLASVLLRAQDAAVPQAAPVPPAPVQPIPYSHKTHLALGLQCQFCHTNPEPGKLMTFPPASTCMSCHRTVAADKPSIRQLAGFAASGKPVPWVRVYRLPDYVYWSHATHVVDAGVTCGECHGPVASRDVIARETAITTMAGCMACHNKRQVFTDCGDCHAPRQ
jgi:hypothetical protein